MNEELKVTITAEVSKLTQGVDKAKKEVKSFKEKVKEASKEVDSKFKDMGAKISNAAKTMAIGVAAIGTALLTLGASTQEYRAEQARLNAAFEQAGGSAEQAKQTYNDLFRVLGDSGTAVEAAQQFANITTEQDKLAEYTTICQGVFAKWGTAIDSAGLAEGINHTIQLGEVQGTLADALEFAGVSVDEFNERLAACTDEAEREKLVRETLTGMYGEAAAIYEETNAQVLAQNEAQAKLQETTAKLGEVVQPVVTAFTNFGAEALALVLPYIKDLAENLMPVLKDVLAAVVDSLAKAFEWVTQHQTLLAVMAGIIGGIVVAIGLYNAVAGVKAAMAAAEVASVWGLVAAYAAQAAAMIVAIAPYLLIVAAIAAVIAIIVLCVKHWDEIKEAVAKAWQWMKDKTKQAVEAIVNFFTNLKQKITDKVEAIKTSIREKFEAIKSSITEKIQAAKTTVLNIFDNIKNGIKEKIENAKNTVRDIIDKIKGFFKFEWSLPKLKLPSVSITGKFSLSPLEVPKFSISWNKLGGIFEKPTLFNYGGSLQGIAEDGAEAVVPLERNLFWLDKLATMLNEKQGATPVVLNVDGKVFAQTAINTINQQTRQTGKLALNLV